MPKLLGFFLLLSILTLGGTYFSATPTQAQEPVKPIPDFGDKIVVDKNRKWDPNGQEFHNPTFPSDNFYPFYASLPNSPKTLVVFGDTALPTIQQTKSWWQNVQIFNFYSPYDNTSSYNDHYHGFYSIGIANNNLNLANYGYTLYSNYYYANDHESGFKTLQTFAEQNPNIIILLNESFGFGMCKTEYQFLNPDGSEANTYWGDNDVYDLHRAKLPNVYFIVATGNYAKERPETLNAINCQSIFGSSLDANEISVSAMNQSGTGLADFSNYLEINPYNQKPIWIISVPGENLPMKSPDNLPTNVSGTSFATPQITALLQQAFNLQHSLGNFTFPPASTFYEIMKKTADVVTDTIRFGVDKPLYLPVANGNDFLLAYESYLKNQPVCHAKNSVMVQGSSFELGCGFNSGISKPVINGYQVTELSQKNGVVAKYLVSCPTPSTCPTAGSYSVMLNGVSAGSLQILSPEVARNQMTETSQMVSVDGKNFAYNLTATNPVSLYVKLTITNASNITQTVSYDLSKFWGNCDGRNGKFDIIGTVAKTINCTDSRLSGMSDQNVISTSNPEFFDLNYQSGSQINLAPGSVKVLVFQLQKFDVSKGLQIPCFTFENTFSPFCTPSIISGATQPTATPTIPASTPTATATPIPGQPTATLPVKTPTPTATATPIAAKRVYLPMVVKRK